MRIPSDAIIPDAKFSKYLLIPRKQDDKSKFLARLGFTQNNPEFLKSAIYELIKTTEFIEDITNGYGTFYRVEGQLIGVNGKNLSVITIWLKRKIDAQFQFITLKPNKEKNLND